MRRESKLSPVQQLFSHFSQHSMEGTRHSWQRLNNAYQDIMKAAIVGGMEFEKDDIRKVYDGHNGGYWFGDSSEWMFTAACKHNNTSACQSYEHFAGREPFMMDGERIHVGREIAWQDHKQLRVTSISSDRLVACAYVWDRSGDYPREKLSKKVTIQLVELKGGERVKRQRKIEAATEIERFLRKHRDFVKCWYVHHFLKQYKTIREAWDAALAGHAPGSRGDILMVAKKFLALFEIELAVPEGEWPSSDTLGGLAELIDWDMLQPKIDNMLLPKTRRKAVAVED